ELRRQRAFDLRLELVVPELSLIAARFRLLKLVGPIGCRFEAAFERRDVEIEDRDAFVLDLSPGRFRALALFLLLLVALHHPMHAARLLDDVRRFVRHQGRVGLRLSAAEPDVRPVRERARADRVGRVVRAAILVHTDAAQIDTHARLERAARRRVHRLARALGLDRARRRGFHRGRRRRSVRRPLHGRRLELLGERLGVLVLLVLLLRRLRRFGRVGGGGFLDRGGGLRLVVVPLLVFRVVLLVFRFLLVRLLVRGRIGFLDRRRRGLRLVVFPFVVRLFRLGLLVRWRLVGFLNGWCRRGLRLVVFLFLVRLLRLGLFVRCRLVSFLNGRCRRGLRLVVFLFVVRLLRLGLLVRWRLVGFLNGRCRRGLRLVVFLFVVRLLRLGLFVRCRLVGFLNGRCRRGLRLVVRLFLVRLLRLGLLVRCGRSSFLNGRRRRLRFLVFLLVVCRFLGVGRALRTGRWQRSDRRDGRRLDRSAARDVRRDAIGFAFVRVAGR